MPEEDNIHQFCAGFGDNKPADNRTNSGRRTHDGLCDAHAEGEIAIKKYMVYSEKRDEEHEIHMDKLDKRISSVDKKVDGLDKKFDKLTDDMPDIVGKSIVNIMKTNLAGGCKLASRWFLKAVLVGLAAGIAWFVIELFKHWNIIEQLVASV